MLQTCRMVECSILLRIHFFYSLLGLSSTNRGDISDEQGERCHRMIGTLENFYRLRSLNTAGNGN